MSQAHVSSSQVHSTVISTDSDFVDDVALVSEAQCKQSLELSTVKIIEWPGQNDLIWSARFRAPVSFPLR
ncbi:hypothetical protein ABER23_33365 [Paenibacillus lautus]|uniref:hypothetical protein n=1 Tax=Paenibacillus lautus TaxID=1401 RepID=UPI003D2E44B8